VDAVLLNGGSFSAPWLPMDRTFAMTLRPACWRHVKTGRRLELQQLDLSGAHAIAGIGHPQRFFQTLKTLGFSGTTEVFSDHYAYRPEDLAAWRGRLLLMTEKDAVKVLDFAAEDWWALNVEADIPSAMIQSLLRALARFPN
jgi:tetraacyldisaccharide 4'-kinase